MYDEKEINQCVDLMANRAAFYLQEGDGLVGWGQFIDTPRSHFQVGTYGTAAGILLLTNANSSENIVRRSLVSLGRLWRDWEQGSRSDRRFVQNSKLAFAHLATQARLETEAVALSHRFQVELKRRLIAGGLWGRWWISPELYDGQIDLLVSSLVILSFFGIASRSKASQRPDWMIEAARVLKQRVLNTSGLPIVTQATAFAAICSVFPDDPGDEVVKGMQELLLLPHQMRGYESTYYYDYQYIDANSGEVVYDREFLVVPPDLLLLLACQSQTKSNFVLTSSCFIVQDVIDKVLENHGLYKTASNEMAGSMVQAWVALALAATRTRGEVPSRLLGLAFWVLAEKSPGILWDKVVPTLAIGSAGIFTVLAADANWAYRIASVAYALLVGSIWGPSVIKRWIPGFSFRQKNRQ